MYAYMLIHLADLLHRLISHYLSGELYVINICWDYIYVYLVPSNINYLSVINN